MNTKYEQDLLNHVVWHCQLVYDLDSAMSAVEYARRDGFLNERNQLTSIGREVAQMMVQDFNSYKDLVDLKLGEMSDLDDQRDVPHPQL